jgi:ubiquinone/menaquinone biosynthesis C-methylase UbiE
MRSASPMSLERYRDVAKDLKRLLLNGKLLDIGCGTGRLLLTLAEEFPETSFNGIDISEEMLYMARANAQRAGLSEKISFKKASAEELELILANSFGFVLSHASFSGWLDPILSLKEISRILKPDGILYISDWNRSAPSDVFSSLMRRALNESEHLERIRMAMEAAYTEEEFKGILGQAPFTFLDFRTRDHWMTAVLKRM